MIPFRSFGKIPRLSREVCITEKIDGTNASVYIERVTDLPNAAFLDFPARNVWTLDGVKYLVVAGSRTRWIFPHDDNFGFAAWVQLNAPNLLELGVGQHFGEWWGSGIQRGYELPKGERRFSLFNVSRWIDSHIPTEDFRSLTEKQRVAPKCCHVVPVLFEGMFDTMQIDSQLFYLKHNGSFAAPGFMNPEGIIVYHMAGDHYYKKTILRDEEPKGKAR